MCLGPRFKLENAEIPAYLVEKKREFLDDLSRFANPYVSNGCLCGGSDDAIIAEYDRYGIPLQTVLCMNCGLMRSDPYYSENVLELFYSKYYHEIYRPEGPEALWNRQIQLAGSAENLDVLETMLKSGAKIFEVGCGAGGTVKWFADRGFETYGCDLDKDYSAYGRQFGLSLEDGGAESLQKYGQANLIIINHVLEHILDPISFLSSLKESLLTSDGMIYIGVPGIYSFPSLMKLGVRNRSGLSARFDLLKYFQNAHVDYYTLDTLKYVASKAGLKCIWGTETVNSVFIADENIDYQPHPCVPKLIKRHLEKVEQVYQTFINQPELLG